MSQGRGNEKWKLYSLLMYSTLLQFTYLLFHTQGTVVHDIDSRSDPLYRYFALEPYLTNTFSFSLRWGDLRSTTFSWVASFTLPNVFSRHQYCRFEFSEKREDLLIIKPYYSYLLGLSFKIDFKLIYNTIQDFSM